MMVRRCEVNALVRHAKEVPDPYSKETVPRIADNYERLTKHAERPAIPHLVGGYASESAIVWLCASSASKTVTCRMGNPRLMARPASSAASRVG